jgi:hypothetical protein
VQAQGKKENDSQKQGRWVTDSLFFLQKAIENFRDIAEGYFPTSIIEETL